MVKVAWTLTVVLCLAVGTQQASVVEAEGLSRSARPQETDTAN